MLYSNLYFIDEIIYCEVRKDKTSLPLEEFAEVLDLPHDGPRFKSNEPEERDNYMYKSVASYFLLDLNSHISSQFTIGFLSSTISLMHYM